MIAKYYFEEWARLPVELSVASEFRYAKPVLDERTLCIFISQSGDTADTIASFRMATDAGATTVALTNVQGSTLTRGASAVVYLQVGPEIGVVATKTFTAQVSLLALLALVMGSARGTLGGAEQTRIVEALRRLPQQMNESLGRAEAVREIA